MALRKIQGADCEKKHLIKNILVTGIVALFAVTCGVLPEAGMEVYEIPFLTWGTAEAVRIIKDQTSNGSFTLTAETNSSRIHLVRVLISVTTSSMRLEFPAPF